MTACIWLVNGAIYLPGTISFNQQGSKKENGHNSF